MKVNRWMPYVRLWISLTALALFFVRLNAQIVQLRPIDVASGIKKGGIRVTIAPSFAGDTLNPFDGEKYTFLTRLQTDTLVVTLESDVPVQIEKSKVFFFSHGSWSLEIANSLPELNSRTGSYERLVESRPYVFNAWDSLTFTQRKAKLVRLRAHSPVDSVFMLGEWALEATVKFTSLLLLPNPVRLLPGTALKMQVKILDEEKNVYPYFLSGPVTWRSTDPSIASVDEYGEVTGVALGTAIITARSSAGPISGFDTVYVQSDFRPEKVKPMTIKVALVLQDPAISSQGFARIHELFRWRDPVLLSNKLIFHFREATDSVVNFQIVETVKDGPLFTRYYGNFMTASQYYALLKEPGWASLRNAADSGKLWFDYREFVKYHHYDEKRNSGQIDEVWVFAGPYLGMYESQLMGPNAFWWNSPPIKDGTALKKLLSVMGLNYERGVDQAFHSFGHRVESAIVQAYHQAQGRPWNPRSTNPTPWDLFTRIDKDLPGQAHVGNVHFPPNGTRDYDYGNTRIVRSYAENWYRYPYLFAQSSDVNVNTWIYTPGDPLAEGQDHLGYLRWWYGHLPRYVGVTDGVLNNWWHYALDYESAVELAKNTPVVGMNNHPPGSVPGSYGLEQNYPNPFNPVTTIRYQLSATSFVTLKVFDVLGRGITTLVNERLDAGAYRATWEASQFPSGVYFYRLQARDVSNVDAYVETRRMLLLR